MCFVVAGNEGCDDSVYLAGGGATRGRRGQNHRGFHSGTCRTPMIWIRSIFNRIWFRIQVGKYEPGEKCP